MVIVILVTAVYSFFQIIYYIKKRYFKEIFAFIVMISISLFYLIDYTNENNAPKLTEIVVHIFNPISRLVFEIKQ